jgi:hypothetical protein
MVLGNVGFNYWQLIEDIRHYRDWGFEAFSRSVHHSLDDWSDAEEYKNYAVEIGKRLGNRFDNLYREELHGAIDILVIGSDSLDGGVKLSPTTFQKIDKVIRKVSEFT